MSKNGVILRGLFIQKGVFRRTDVGRNPNGEHADIKLTVNDMKDTLKDTNYGQATDTAYLDIFGTANAKKFHFLPTRIFCFFCLRSTQESGKPQPHKPTLRLSTHLRSYQPALKFSA